MTAVGLLPLPSSPVCRGAYCCCRTCLPILPRSRARIPLALLGTLLIGGSLVFIMGRIIPANDYRMVYGFLTALREDPAGGLDLLVENISNQPLPLHQLAQTAERYRFNHRVFSNDHAAGNTMEDRYAQAADASNPRLQIGFHLYNLFSVLILSLLLYIMGTWELPVISIHLLLTFVLLIALGGRSAW